MAWPMFSGSGHMHWLLWKLPDVWTYEDLKLVAVDRKLIWAIFDSSQIYTSSSLLSSQVVLPDPENMVIAVGLSLLSCIRQAEICVISYLLPVDSRHLRVGRPQKCRYSRACDSLPFGENRMDKFQSVPEIQWVQLLHPSRRQLNKKQPED